MVMTGSFMTIMDVSILNVALPQIMISLRTDVKTVTWIVTAGMLASAVSMPPTGWLGNRFGPERMYIFGLIIFTSGSVLCSLSWDLPSLIVFRVVQAVGGGLTQPTGMALIVQYFPPEERGRALGFWGIVVMMAPTLGPTTGGYITDWFGWRAIFWLHVIVGVIVIPAALQLVGGQKAGPKPPPFDWQGFVALSIFLLSFLLGLDQVQEQGASSTAILIAWAIASVAFVTFIVSELSGSNPIFPFGILRHRDFTLGLFISLTRGIGLFGSIFLVPLFMQKVQWHSTIQTGLTVMPGALMVAIVMPMAGFLTDRIGSRIPASVGIAVTALSFYLYYQIDLYSSVWDIIFLQLIRGLGVGMIMPPSTTAAMNAVEKHQTGTAAALINVSQRVGGSFGIAFLATLLERRTVVHLERLSDRLSLVGEARGIGSEPVRILMQSALSAGYGGPDALRAARETVLTFVSKSAQTRAYADVFIIAGLLILLGLPAALCLSSKAPGKRAVKSKPMQPAQSNP